VYGGTCRSRHTRTIRAFNIPGMRVDTPPTGVPMRIFCHIPPKSQPIKLKSIILFFSCDNYTALVQIVNKTKNHGKPWLKFRGGM